MAFLLVIKPEGGLGDPNTGKEERTQTQGEGEVREEVEEGTGFLRASWSRSRLAQFCLWPGSQCGYFI